MLNRAAPVEENKLCGSVFMCYDPEFGRENMAHDPNFGWILKLILGSFE